MQPRFIYDENAKLQIKKSIFGDNRNVLFFTDANSCRRKAELKMKII